jgi:hypothetical protein
MPRRSFLVALTLVSIALVGCNSETNICTIKGTLQYQGKPMPQVYIRFEPDDLGTKSTSMAVTDANGQFEMMIGSTRGVFRGQVKIFCDDPLAAMGTTSPVPKEIEPAYRALCAKYGSGKSTYVMTIDKSNDNLILNLE